MFWNKKETKSGLPDLPQISLSAIGMPDSEQKSSISENKFPDLGQNEGFEKHFLPSFPDSPSDKSFSQTAVKEVIENGEQNTPYETSQKMTLPVYSRENSFKTIESSDPSTLLPPPENTFSPSRPTISKTFENDSTERKNPAIFVKIDKFNSAKRALSSAQEKLDEIEELLKRIREVKLREEQELSGWEKELSSIKIKVKEVTENIFESLE